MPRGDNFRKVTDDQIAVQFDRADRPVLSVGEVRNMIIKNEGVEITYEAIRQRLKRLNGVRVEMVKIGGKPFWKKAGTEVFTNAPDPEPMDPPKSDEVD